MFSSLEISAAFLFSRNPFSFFSDWAVINFRSNRSLKSLFSRDPCPPSVQTTKSSSPDSDMIFRSSGFNDCCSFPFSLKMEKDNGIYIPCTLPDIFCATDSFDRNRCRLAFHANRFTQVTGNKSVNFLRRISLLS